MTLHQLIEDFIEKAIRVGDIYMEPALNGIWIKSADQSNFTVLQNIRWQSLKQIL